MAEQRLRWLTGARPYLSPTLSPSLSPTLSHPPGAALSCASVEAGEALDHPSRAASARLSCPRDLASRKGPPGGTAIPGLLRPPSLRRAADYVAGSWQQKAEGGLCESEESRSAGRRRVPIKLPRTDAPRPAQPLHSCRAAPCLSQTAGSKRSAEKERACVERAMARRKLYLPMAQCRV